MKSKDPFAKRSLGQNFLVDQNVIARILGALDPREQDVVLEIGPGRGALTEKLIERAGLVYALEFDRDLVPLLRAKFAKHENFSLVEGDALKIDFETLDRSGKKLRLIANLPYNISTAILQRLFACTAIIEDCVLMFQREVVERIAAAPGTSERGFLSVLAQAHFVVEKLFDVPPGAFRPIPKVSSSVIRCVPRTDLVFDHSQLEAIVSLSFSQKRKTILNNLKKRFPEAEAVLSKAGIDPRRRAETLTVNEWISLAEGLLGNSTVPK